MKRPIPGFVILLSAVLLHGCAVSTHSIVYLQLAAGDARGDGAETPVIFVDQVRIPDYLKRDDLLLRDTENSLRYDPFQRWAEPLDLGIQRVIAERLAREMGTRGVVRFPAPDRPDAWRLGVEILRFEAVRGRAVLRGEAQWIRGRDDDSAISVSFYQEQPLTERTGDAIAAAMSELLWRFTEELVDALPRRGG